MALIATDRDVFVSNWWAILECSTSLSVSVCGLKRILSATRRLVVANEMFGFISRVHKDKRNMSVLEPIQKTKSANLHIKQLFNKEC